MSADGWKDIVTSGGCNCIPAQVRHPLEMKED
jgi:hypothetical protein